jgi:hypothetical protein
MNSFDPVAVAVEWFDTYRSSALAAAILELCAGTATLEFGCHGQTIIVGNEPFASIGAIVLYGHQRLL